MRERSRELKAFARPGVVGLLLLATVLATPNAGHPAHASFFAIAWESPWSRGFDLPAAWCSVKIILLSVGTFLVIEGILNVLIRTEYEMICVAFLTLAICPLLMGFFGIYQFVKAVL